MRLVWMLLFCVLTGCHAAPVPGNEPPKILFWSAKTLDESMARAWTKEIDKVEKCPYVLVMCHGSNRIIHNLDGTTRNAWFVEPDAPRIPMEVERLAEALYNEHQKRLWLIVCNPGGHTLLCPGVRYARTIVWAEPNAATALFPFRRHDWAGRVEDFIDSGGRVRLAGER